MTIKLTHYPSSDDVASIMQKSDNIPYLEQDGVLSKVIPVNASGKAFGKYRMCAHFSGIGSFNMKDPH